MTHSRTWFITGAGRGLGRALTIAALEAGDSVFATVRGSHSLPSRDDLVVHHLDVTDRDACRAAVDRALSVFGVVDVLVNNAGYGLIGTVEEVSEIDARAIIDTDLFGPLWLSQAVLPGMRERGSGHIIQISTVGAVGTMPTLGLYNAAKWGLEGVTEALAAEARDFGIRVTIVEPGSIDTDWGTASMRFSEPIAAYDSLRTSLFGSAEVPWPTTEETGGGTPPTLAAQEILSHVADSSDDRRRLLVGDDSRGQVAAALALRLDDYQRDDRFTESWRAR